MIQVPKVCQIRAVLTAEHQRKQGRGKARSPLHWHAHAGTASFLAVFSFVAKR